METKKSELSIFGIRKSILIILFYFSHRLTFHISLHTALGKWPFGDWRESRDQITRIWLYIFGIGCKNILQIHSQKFPMSTHLSAFSIRVLRLRETCTVLYYNHSSMQLFFWRHDPKLPKDCHQTFKTIPPQHRNCCQVRLNLIDWGH